VGRLDRGPKLGDEILAVLAAESHELYGVVERVADGREIVQRRAGIDGDLVEHRDRAELEDASRRLGAELLRHAGDRDLAFAHVDLERARRYDEAGGERTADRDATRALHELLRLIEVDHVACVEDAVGEDRSAGDRRFHAGPPYALSLAGRNTALTTAAGREPRSPPST
jgi:hypothetical protein